MGLPTTERDIDLGRYHAPNTPTAEVGAGLVLIHDVWGPSDHSRELATDLAREGFGVLEIDLYRGMANPSIDAPGDFIRGLSDPEILADLDVAAAWLSEESGVRGKIGVVGVCMGGTYALLAACSSPRFAAAAPFYGILSYDEGMLANPNGRDRARKPQSPLEAARQLKMPIVASFGADDEFVPVSDVERLEAGLRESPWDVRVDVYPGAGHAFLNRTREAAYRADASARAWARVIPFLHAHLDG